jgi:hypothetical protein
VRLSLFTNVTREPAVTVMFWGDTPDAVMVMVVVAVGGPVGGGVVDGELGLLLLSPPHPAASAATATVTSPIRRSEKPLIRRTFSRC